MKVKIAKSIVKIDQKNRKQIIAAILFASTIIGVTFAGGTLANYFADQLNLDNLQLNLLPMSMFMWYVIFGVPFSMILNKISSKKVIFVGLLVLLLGFLCPLFGRSFGNALLTFILIGAGNVILQTVFNPFLTDLAPKNETASFIILRQIMESATAIILPMILIWTQRTFLNWRLTFLLFIVMTIVALFWFKKIKVPNLPREGKITRQILLQILRQKGFLIMLIGIVMIGGFNNSFTTIIPRLIVERADVSKEIANLSGTIFFSLRLTGAIFGAFILTKIKPWKYFKVMSILGLVAILALFFVTTRNTIFIVVGVTGFAYSSLASLIFAQMLKSAAGHMNATNGIIISGWSGAALISLVTGVITKATNTQYSAVFVFLTCSLFIVFLGRYLAKQQTAAIK